LEYPKFTPSVNQRPLDRDRTIHILRLVFQILKKNQHILLTT